MLRQRQPEDHQTGWRALILAAGIAVGVLFLLAATVGTIWLVGRYSPSAPAVGGLPPPTPTPRSLSFLREGESNSAPAAQLPPLGGDAVPEASDAAPPVDSTPAPALLTMPDGEQSGSLDGGRVFSAPDNNPFASFASGSWRPTSDALRNQGKSADAEPWLKITTIPGPSIAIEAEIRVNGLLDTFCNQSFGLAAGNANAEKVFGAGVLFPCGDGTATARLTDVSVWEDGYHADPTMAENAFDPGDDWHTYRFELRGDSVRLIVDGDGIVTGTLDAPLDVAGEAEAGIWSQGVDLDIRSIEIFPLPA